jgi:hypothetical protein
MAGLTWAVNPPVQGECQLQGVGGASWQLGADQHPGDDVSDKFLCCSDGSSLQGKHNQSGTTHVLSHIKFDDLQLSNSA